jgi:hypothetical protein
MPMYDGDIHEGGERLWREDLTRPDSGNIT